MRDGCAAVEARIARAPSPVVVAVDGRSGSGKSTFADLVTAAQRAAGRDVTLLRMDAVYPGWDGLDAAVTTLTTDVLPRLAAGEDAQYRSWLWTRSRPGPVRTVRAASLVVVEGVGAGALESRHLVDCLVWVHAPDHVRYDRAMARDGDGYRSQWQRWAQQEESYLSADAPAQAADLWVDSCVA